MGMMPGFEGCRDVGPGWTVFDSIGSSDTRYCVTTRSDGHVTVKIGLTTDDPQHRTFLNVTTANVNFPSLIKRKLGF